MAKHKRSGRGTPQGVTAEDEVTEAPLVEAELFGPDTGRTRLVGGGVKRGEALQPAEEADDFEDGRSAGGLTSRSQEDRWARGDVGSRAEEVRSGVLSVERSPESARRAVPPRFQRSPEGERGDPGFRPRRRAARAGRKASRGRRRARRASQTF